MSSDNQDDADEDKDELLTRTTERYTDISTRETDDGTYGGVDEGFDEDCNLFGDTDEAGSSMSMLDLARSHSRGEITIRQIASLTGLSTEDAYDQIAELYETHDLGDDDSTPTTITPSDPPSDHADETCDTDNDHSNPE